MTADNQYGTYILGLIFGSMKNNVILLVNFTYVSKIVTIFKTYNSMLYDRKDYVIITSKTNKFQKLLCYVAPDLWL